VFDLTQKEFEKKLAEIQEKNKQKEYRKLLREERKKSRTKIKLPSTSKLILLVAFLLCLEIIIFCEYMMVKTGDLSSLYSMIGVASALIPLCLGYYFKSKAENTAGGITYDMAMLEANQNLNYEESTDAVG
jgi:uncharacterized membrane protein (DUF106 family)